MEIKIFALTLEMIKISGIGIYIEAIKPLELIQLGFTQHIPEVRPGVAISGVGRAAGLAYQLLCRRVGNHETRMPRTYDRG